RSGPWLKRLDSTLPLDEVLVEEAEVLVVGGGPAGSTFAAEMASRGHDVLVVEEHPRIGHPVQCAGLVSDRVLELAGSRGFVRASVRGATVVGPSLRAVSFAAPDARAHVIDRAGLDIHLADRAADRGARFALDSKFVGMEGAPNGGLSVRVVSRDGATRLLHTRLLVGADGVTSAVARAVRLRRRVEILPAFEAEFARSPGNPDEVEVYLGRDLAPGLFGWWIPDGAGGARLGVAVEAGRTTAREFFERLCVQFARRHGSSLQTPTSYIVSGIPIGTLPRYSGHRVLLLGDAAAQVKPLSGGGIFTGMRAAGIAAPVAHEALRDGDLSASRLGEYDRRWREALGEEFDRALYLRRLFARLTDAELDEVVDALEGSEMAASIVAFGDIDFPTHVARRLLRQSPSLLRLFPKALAALFPSRRSFRAPDLDAAAPR
ncbi:MAG TPA: NAD(P)/FAD-dependent oxidoreductase, partial [Thermoplasmata archaeon]|nr:NAD(P)/FAD-dependent oxidoreductase [Thermoplasmata archaeon]